MPVCCQALEAVILYLILLLEEGRESTHVHVHRTCSVYMLCATCACTAIMLLDTAGNPYDGSWGFVIIITSVLIL